MADANFLSVERRSVISSIEKPDTNAIYPGISGSTQRERNYESPAAHTFSSENSCPIINNICLFRNQPILLIADSQSLKVAYHLQKIQAFS